MNFNFPSVIILVFLEAPGTAIIMIIIHTLAVECSLGSVRHHYLGEADGLPAQLWCDPQMDDSEKCRSGGHAACRAPSCVGAAVRTGLSKPTWKRGKAEQIAPPVGKNRATVYRVFGSFSSGRRRGDVWSSLRRWAASLMTRLPYFPDYDSQFFS